MSDDATKHVESQLAEIFRRLEGLEAYLTKLAAITAHSQELLAKYVSGYFLIPPEMLPPPREWPRGLIFVPSMEQSRQEGGEWPAPPWQYLVKRSHPWRRQLYVKGRNMTVRQLVGTVKANKLSPEEAAGDLDLPAEAIREAIAYAEENAELLRLEADMEALLLKRGKIRGSVTVPR
jgi:uncharacterized protein (DUF433 family)